MCPPLFLTAAFRKLSLATGKNQNSSGLPALFAGTPAMCSRLGRGERICRLLEKAET
jgi:hypothetical protein